MYIDDQMEYHKMQANWWTHAASNGHSNKRKIKDGNGRLYTDDELRDDAMSIAQNHMKIFMECAEYKQENKL